MSKTMLSLIIAGAIISMLLNFGVYVMGIITPTIIVWFFAFQFLLVIFFAIDYYYTAKSIQIRADSDNAYTLAKLNSNQ